MSEKRHAADLAAALATAQRLKAVAEAAEKRVTELEAERDELRGQLDQMTVKAVEWQNEYRKLKDENARLRAALADAGKGAETQPKCQFCDDGVPLTPDGKWHHFQSTTTELSHIRRCGKHPLIILPAPTPDSGEWKE